VILFIALLPTLLSAQTANQLESLLTSNAVTFEQAAWFVLEAAEKLSPEYSSEDAFDFAVKQEWLPKNAMSNNPINLRQASLLIMQAFNLKGGPMYSLTKSSHYAYREMVYQNIIQGRADPMMKVSGELLVFLVNRVLFRIDENPWVLPELPVTAITPVIELHEDESITDEEVPEEQE
jgi:hypothetical protein